MTLKGGKVNKSLKAWVNFVKKVAKEEKLNYSDAIHRAKVRKDKGEKWMLGGNPPADSGATAALENVHTDDMTATTDDMTTTPTCDMTTTSSGDMTTTPTHDMEPTVLEADAETELSGGKKHKKHHKKTRKTHRKTHRKAKKSHKRKTTHKKHSRKH